MTKRASWPRATNALARSSRSCGWLGGFSSVGSSTYFLTTFGRATRETVCSCEVKMEPTLSQALHLLNGDTVNAKIQQGGVIPRLIAQKKFPEERVVDLYLRTLARMPTKAEMDKLLPLLAPGTNQEQALLDIFWALLNSREFLFNH